MWLVQPACLCVQCSRKGKKKEGGGNCLILHVCQLSSDQIYRQVGREGHAQLQMEDTCQEEEGGEGGGKGRRGIWPTSWYPFCVQVLIHTSV